MRPSAPSSYKEKTVLYVMLILENTLKPRYKINIFMHLQTNKTTLFATFKFRKIF